MQDCDPRIVLDYDPHKFDDVQPAVKSPAQDKLYDELASRLEDVQKLLQKFDENCTGPDYSRLEEIVATLLREVSAYRAADD
jgi:hypothetical protein